MYASTKLFEGRSTHNGDLSAHVRVGRSFLSSPEYWRPYSGILYIRSRTVWMSSITMSSLVALERRPTGGERKALKVGMNKHFEEKFANYVHVHVIKNTGSISVNDKYTQMLLVGGPICV